MNYVDHCLEQDFPIPTEPVVFSKFASAITEPDGDILLENTEVCVIGNRCRSRSNLIGQELDFEVELAIVIGKGGKKISKEDAMSHVVGYTCVNDVSARDWQMKRNGKQWLLGKTFDSYCPIGPAIVTTDELKDPHSLSLKTVLNDQVRAIRRELNRRPPALNTRAADCAELQHRPTDLQDRGYRGMGVSVYDA